MYIVTEIYFTNLNYETQEQLKQETVDRLKMDADFIKEVEHEHDEENEQDEITNETKEHRKWAIEMLIEEKAEDIINRTFYGEVNIGDEN